MTYDWSHGLESLATSPGVSSKLSRLSQNQCGLPVGGFGCLSWCVPRMHPWKQYGKPILDTIRCVRRGMSLQEHCALPDYVEFIPQKPVDLSSVLSAASADAMDLLLQLLVLRPDKRATADEALRHPYFTKHKPPPCLPSQLALAVPEERLKKVWNK